MDDMTTSVTLKGMHTRYPSDLTDAEWAALQPYLPAARVSAPKHAAPLEDRVEEDGLLLLVEDEEAAVLHCSWPHQPTPG